MRLDDLFFNVKFYLTFGFLRCGELTEIKDCGSYSIYVICNRWKWHKGCHGGVKR